MDALLFIDTNIFLDFYRERKSDVSIKFLEQIELCKDRLILDSQTEMEYKKIGRQSLLIVLENLELPIGESSQPLLLSPKPSHME